MDDRESNDAGQDRDHHPDHRLGAGWAAYCRAARELAELVRAEAERSRQTARLNTALAAEHARLIANLAIRPTSNDG